MKHWNAEKDSILKAQEGDQEAISMLYDKYKALIITIATQYGYKGAPWEDVMSASKTGFFYALSKHDPDKGYLGSYAKQWCMHYCKKALKIQAVHIPLYVYKSVSTTITKVPYNPRNHDERRHVLDNEAEEEKNYQISRLHENLAKLTEREQAIIKARFGINCKKMKLNDMVVKFGFNSPQYVSMTCSKIIKKLKEMI